jgi:RNA-directed DNA polymerase
MRGVLGDRHPYRDRHLAKACQRRGFGWKRWSRAWLYGTLGLFSEYRVTYRQPLSAVAPV